MARKIRVQIGIALFMCEKIVESVWRAMGWVCDRKPNAVINSFRESVYKWRSTEMVALPTDRNDGTGSRKPHKMET